MRNFWYRFLYAIDHPENLRNFLCRLRGHSGVVWYNVAGFEPDYHCARCGEDLG